MRGKSKIILLVLGIAITVVVVSLVGASITKRKCRNQLRSIGCAIELHRETHHGLYPSNLGEMENGLVKPVLHCPGVHSRGQGEADYIYVKWPEQTSDASNSLPAEYPVVYDSRLSNHQGKGINVLLVDGSVIWDEQGRWLSQFASDHHGIILPK
jgi:prepilin-type processing-associated H-X9-DG protein